MKLDDCDPGPGTLRVGRRRLLLDSLTRDHLRLWLTAWKRRWPTTANPHLLVSVNTTGGAGPVSRGFIQAVFRPDGLTAQGLRVTRFLDEAEACRSDPVRLVALFGVSGPNPYPLHRRRRHARRPA